MKNKTKMILIILAFSLIIVIAIFFKTTNKKDDVIPTNQAFKRIDDYGLFFGIDKLVNDYIDENDSGRIDNYFYSNDVYYIKFDKNEYYLIVGEKLTYDYNTTKLSIKKDVAYLINNDTYNQLYNIQEIDDYNAYLNNDKLHDNVSITNGKSISQYIYYSADELYIMNYYINYFKELLFVDYNKAYQLLDNKYKNKVGSLEDFNTYRETIYAKLNNIITNYSIKGDNGKKTYQIILNNGVKIDFQENSIMNFTVNISNIE